LSKTDALLKAKRSAIENGIGTILMSETEIKNFQLKKDLILTKTVGSVKKYHILAEKKQADNTYYVKIDAEVSVADIKADLVGLKILLESMDKPRMMIVVQEDSGNYAESAILDYLTGKGFDLVDPAIVATLMNKEEAVIQRAIEGELSAILHLGVSNGAEYLIVGKVTRSMGNMSAFGSKEMKSCQANITAKVVNCSNSRIIASKSSSGAAVHISEDIAKAQASTKAARTLMDNKLFEQIVSSYEDMVNNGISLDIVINGVENFKIQKAIRNLISGFPDVVSVNKRSFSQGKVELSVLFKGNSDSFSEIIDGQNIEEKKLSVTDIIGNRIIVHLQ